MNRIFKMFLLLILVTVPAALFVLDNQHLVSDRSGQSQPVKEQTTFKPGDFFNTSLHGKSYR